MTVMNALPRLTCLALIALLAACGGEPPATEPQAPAAPAPTEVVEEVITETPAPATDATAEVEAVIEAAAEETAGEPTAEDTMVKELVAAAPAASTREWRYSSGDHYTQLTSAQGTSSAPGGVEVAEVFWYGCPHCYSFDPYLSRWESEQPEDVRFVRIPVMWNPTNEIHARIYYTAEALNRLEVIHPAVFDAMHRQGKTLTREADIREFFIANGVSGEDFDKTFRSFAVESKLKKALNLTQRYRISSVPVLVINGKYLATGPEVKSFDDMLAVTGELIERERQGL